MVTRTTKPKPLLPNDQLVFGKTFSDHMLEVPWTASAGWGTPVISPYHKIALEPSASVFHYASEVQDRTGDWADWSRGRARARTTGAGLLALPPTPLTALPSPLPPRLRPALASAV